LSFEVLFPVVTITLCSWRYLFNTSIFTFSS
jgi:hypothetical protein